MKLTEQQIANIRSLLSTKNGLLKRNVGYVSESLYKLLNGHEISPTHRAKDFPKTFFLVVEELGLELKEHGDKIAFLKNLSGDYYTVSVSTPPMTFIELLIACDIKTHNITQSNMVKYLQHELTSIRSQLQDLPKCSDQQQIVNSLVQRIEVTIDILSNGTLNPMNYKFPNGNLAIDSDNNKTALGMDFSKISEKLAMIEQDIINHVVRI